MKKTSELCNKTVSSGHALTVAEGLSRFQAEQIEMLCRFRNDTLAAARKSVSVRKTVVGALLTLGLGAFTSHARPMSDRELVAALRVSFRLQLSQDPVWKQFYKHVLGLLLRALTGPNPSRREVGQCRTVLSNLACYYRADLDRLRKQLNMVSAGWKHSDGSPPIKPVGRRTSELNRRALASVRFLKLCGDKRAEETVSQELWDLCRKHLASDSIRQMVWKRKKKLGVKRFADESDRELNWWLRFVCSATFSGKSSGGVNRKRQ
jgi:hypothetical protein